MVQKRNYALVLSYLNPETAKMFKMVSNTGTLMDPRNQSYLEQAMGLVEANGRQAFAAAAQNPRHSQQQGRGSQNHQHQHQQQQQQQHQNNFHRGGGRFNNNNRGRGIHRAISNHANNQPAPAAAGPGANQ